MSEPIWIKTDVILAAQAKLLDRFGGLPGIRDQELPESVLNRPVQLFTYGNPSIFALAGGFLSETLTNTNSPFPRGAHYFFP